MAAGQVQEVGLKERFYREFQHDVAALQEQIEHLTVISPTENERNEAVDNCLAEIDRLSHEVKDASSYIPAYDQRSYSQTIKSLSEKLQSIRTTFNPPKKFSFKNRKTAPANQRSDAVLASDTLNSYASYTSTLNIDGKPREASDVVEEVEDDGIPNGPGVQRPAFANTTKVAISNHTSLHVVLPATVSHATSSGTVSNLQHCVIDLSPPTITGPFSALYLKNVKDSLIVCGQVAGAIHITNIENSVLVTSCRQFRMHASKNVAVYLHSASRPIIEDCRDVRFAPLPQAFTAPEVSQSVNQWDQIDDFKWLKIEPSPNFGLLKETDRIKDDIWRVTVLEGESMSLQDVLEAVNVQ